MSDRRKPAWQRWLTRRQRKRGWKPGTLGYSPSLAMLDAWNAAAPEFHAAMRSARAQMICPCGGDRKGGEGCSCPPPF